MFLNLESAGIEMMGIPYSSGLGGLHNSNVAVNGGITALSDINPILPQQSPQHHRRAAGAAT